MSRNGTEVWFSHEQGSANIFVALFNLNENASDVAVSFASLGLTGKVAVRDLWKKEDAGLFKKGYHRQLNKHCAALLKLSAQ